MNETQTREVKGIVEAWAAGVRARDIEAVMEHHADDLLMFDVVGPLRLRGREAYRKTWDEQFFPWHGSAGRFEMRDLEVTAGEHVAFATALLDCAGTEAGRPAASVLRLTVCLERREGDWHVVHEHHSEPLPFDTDRVGAAE